MLKLIGIFLVSIICASCSSKESNIPWRAEFQNRKMSPLYFFQNREEMANIPLKVEGYIPTWLEGDFIRNGPGLVRGQNAFIESWFDGLAKLHAFNIHQGEIIYSCKFINSVPYQEFLSTGELDFAGFAQQAASSPFSFIDFLFNVPNKDIMNANVNVAKINNKLIALTEAPLPVEFDKNLTTLRPFEYADDLPKNYSVESAHILQDPDTKALWNYLIKVGLFGSSYQVYTIPPQSSERKLIASIPVSSVSYMHSFSLAGRYVVLVDYPLRAKNPMDMVNGFIEAFSWYPNESTVIYVIDKLSGQVWSLATEAFFSFHHINGFEKDGKIFIDLIAYPTPDINYKVNKYPFITNLNNKVMRLEINLSSNNIKIYPITQELLEFPRLNDSFMGKEYKYFYAVHIQDKGYGIIKYNHTGSNHTYWFQENAYASEPVFVPNPHAQTEDDGVLLCVLNDLTTRKAFLLVLDAKNLKELARIEAPHFIPFGFHGQFFQVENK